MRNIKNENLQIAKKTFKKYSKKQIEIEISLGKESNKVEGEILCGTQRTFAELRANTIVHDIVLNKERSKEEINDTLIHELIHSSLKDIILNQSTMGDAGLATYKLASKVNRNEELVSLLAHRISENIKLVLNPSKKENG